MLIKRFYDDKLAQASYLVGCAATGEALVVDPNRDVEQFVEAAEREGLRITHITETHIHADFVSGARELAERTGGRLYLSAEGGDQWQYAWAEEAGATLLRDGDTFKVGNVKIDVLHTPGHTPEHLSFVVTDTAGADQPMGVFTGDFIFVGDVGRPDLLERAAKYAGTMEAGARTLYRSIDRFRNLLPDYVQLWPGHGAGSACGKALGAVPQTTLGYEKLFNWGLAAASEQEFVDAVLAGQPEPPMYFAEMKRINREGPRVLGGFRRPQRLPENRLEQLIDQDALVVDTRHATDYASGHIPGTLNVPLGNSFTTWAGSVLPYDQPFYLIVEDPSGRTMDEIIRDLAMIGLDDVAGCFGADVVQTWIDTDRAAQGVPEVAPDQLEELLRVDAVELVDVRNSSEWNEGHIPGSRNVPLGRLPELLDQIPRDRPVVVHCESGGRAAVAIGVLQANGFGDVRHLTGDMTAWRRDNRNVIQAGDLVGA
ncbi:MAG TPA: MBL fold metallo-hydrolase [Longimicrobiales bacterium]|nr:MBL fold metallo-hydrolase [Longimicrobiales bacterium]